MGLLIVSCSLAAGQSAGSGGRTASRPSPPRWCSWLPCCRCRRCSCCRRARLKPPLARVCCCCCVFFPVHWPQLLVLSRCCMRAVYDVDAAASPNPPAQAGGGGWEKNKGTHVGLRSRAFTDALTCARGVSGAGTRCEAGHAPAMLVRRVARPAAFGAADGLSGKCEVSQPLKPRLRALLAFPAPPLPRPGRLGGHNPASCHPTDRAAPRRRGLWWVAADSISGLRAAVCSDAP